MAKFKKSLLAIFVAITAVARAAPVGQFSRPLSFHSLTPVPDKDKGAKRSRSPGLFSRQPPSDSHLPATHIPIGQPPIGLPAISPGAPSDAPAQRRDPEPEEDDDFDAQSSVTSNPGHSSIVGSIINDLDSEVFNTVSDVVSDADAIVLDGLQLIPGQSTSSINLPLSPEDLSTPAA
jgi:hypothetical protein